MNATIRVVLLSACAFFAARSAGAGGIAPYFESSANQKPSGDAGLSVTNDWVKINADLALRAPDGDTRIIPQLSSVFALTSRLGLETSVHFEDWSAHAEIPGANVDTRLHFRPSVPVFKELEGRVWRSPDGQSGRMLKFGFYQRLGDPTEQKPLTLRSNASFEATVGALDSSLDASLESRPASRRVRIETEVGGLLARMRGRSAIKIRLDKVVGAAAGTTSSVALNHSWRVGPADLGLNFKLLDTSVETATSLEPSFSLDWQWPL
jgi:hypothetical protein